MLSTVRPPSVIHTTATDRGKLVTFTAGKRRRLLFAGDGRRSVYDKKSQRYAEDNRTQFNRTLGKSEAAVTTSKRLLSKLSGSVAER